MHSEHIDTLRFLLLAGLVLHKLVWEILKRKYKVRGIPADTGTKLSIRLIKLGKVFVLLFLIVQTVFLNVLPILGEPNPLRVPGFVIFVIGLSTAILGRLQLGDNWADLEDRQLLPDQKLVSTGIYRYIRHPIYAGDLILLIGLQLALNSWLVLGVLVLIPVVLKQAIKEESMLAQALPGYIDYCKFTKRFIPFVV